MLDIQLVQRFSKVSPASVEHCALVNGVPFNPSQLQGLHQHICERGKIIAAADLCANLRTTGAVGKQIQLLFLYFAVLHIATGAILASHTHCECCRRAALADWSLQIGDCRL